MAVQVPQLYLPQWGESVGNAIGQGLSRRFEMQRQQEQQNRLAQMLPGAMSGDTQALNALAQVSPDAYLKVLGLNQQREAQTYERGQAEAQQAREALKAQLSEVAGAIVNTPEAQLPQVWAQLRGAALQRNPALAQYLPETYGPEILPTAKSIYGIKPAAPEGQQQRPYWLNADGSVDPVKYQAATGLATAGAQMRYDNAPPISVAPNTTLVDPRTHQPIYTAPPAPDPKTTGPMPPASIKALRDSREALRAAQEMDRQLGEGLNLIKGGQPIAGKPGATTAPLETGLEDRAAGYIRNKLDYGNANSRGLLRLKQIKEKLRSDYLMLAKGVQTEGDAVRAMDAMMPDTNDPEAIVQQFQAVQAATQALAATHAESVRAIEAEYGRGQRQPTGASGSWDAPAQSGWSIEELQ